MEEQNQLDNLLLQDKKQSNLKKLLLAASLLLLVLILIILITKSVIEPEKERKSPIVLPPEPAVETARPEPKEPLFEEVPIEEENPAPATRTAAATPAPEPKPSIKPEPRPQPEPVAKPNPKPAQPETAPAPKPKTASAAKPKPKPEPKTRSSQNTRNRTFADLAKGYYIQVGAFRTRPNRKFLADIEKEGLKFTIITSLRDGVPYKKVLIGPFGDYKEAKGALKRIKRRFNQNAYILKKR